MVLTITKQPHVDTRDLTERVLKILKDTEKLLPADIIVESDLFQMRDFIERGIWNVGEALVIGAVTVYILGKDAKTPAPIKADKVLLTVKKPSLQLDLKPQKQKDDPEGTASVFVGTHDNFAKEEKLEGSLSAEFGGKQYAGDFKYPPEK